MSTSWITGFVKPADTERASAIVKQTMTATKEIKTMLATMTIARVFDSVLENICFDEVVVSANTDSTIERSH